MIDPLPPSDPFRGVTLGEIRASLASEADQARRIAERAEAKAAKVEGSRKRKEVKHESAQLV